MDSLFSKNMDFNPISSNYDFSVLLPANSTVYLDDTLNSLVMQEYDLNLFEIVIVSPKNIINEIDLLIRKYSESLKIRRVMVHEAGIVAALRKGLEICQSEYIARLDQDDLVTATRFEKQLKFLRKRKKYGAIGGQLILINSENQEIGFSYYPIFQSEIFLTKNFINPLAHPGVMFRKSFVLSVENYRECYPEDWDLWLRLTLNYKIANLPIPVLKYRIHKDQLSRQNRYTNKAAIRTMYMTHVDRTIIEFKHLDFLKFFELSNKFWRLQRLIISKSIFYIRKGVSNH